MDNSEPMKAIPMAELLPRIRDILSKDAKQSLTAQKMPSSALPATRTTGKVIKPMTIAEMRADIEALKIHSPKRLAQGATSGKKKWNSSCKVEHKTVSHTAGGQMRNHSVRKVLNFQQPKPKIPMSTMSNARMTSKREMKAKISLHHLQALNTVRISGICHIPETPLLSNKPVKNKMSLANKENISSQTKIKKVAATPKSSKSSLRKRVMASQVLDTPLSNMSWTSSCDASFLQNEKDIELIEGKTKASTEEQMFENIAEVSPPVSTPFKEYRNVNEFFNNSSDIKDSSPAADQDNTIMSFEKPSLCKENNDDSVIVSLCDMLNKATVSKPATIKTSTEINDLLEVEKEIENVLEIIESSMKTLSTIKEGKLKILQKVRNLIYEKKEKHTFESEKENTLIETTKDINKFMVTPLTLQRNPIVGEPCSVIKSCLKSPSYKIPKKNMSCIRKKVFYNSLTNVSNIVVSPPREMNDQALSMYMKMKENMIFLKTPVVKQRHFQILDTPATTSNNLQKQLDKLYSER